jgi:hypothetical protein
MADGKLVISTPMGTYRVVDGKGIVDIDVNASILFFANHADSMKHLSEKLDGKELDLNGERCQVIFTFPDVEVPEGFYE